MPTPKATYNTGKGTTNYRSRTTSKTTMTTGWNPRAFPPTRYVNTGKEIQWRIGSYRNIYSQFTGAGKVTAFSPTTANKWMKWVHSGARIYKFNNKDFCKHFGNQWITSSPTSAFRWLKQKYGTGSKAGTRGKANCWLVAATPNLTGRPWNNYNWK